MAERQTIHIDLVDNSDLVKEEMVLAAIRALERCGREAESHAVDNCPKDTGNLNGSITHQVDISELICQIGTNVEYAPYVELGTGIYYPGGRQTPWVYQDIYGEWHLTHGQRAQPYLKPAVADHVPQYRGIIEGEMKG